MYLKHMPYVIKHIIKMYEAAEHLMGHEAIDTYSMQILLPLDLAPVVDQTYIRWDFDDERNGNKFLIVECINPYPMVEYIRDNSIIEKFYIDRNGTIEVKHRDGYEYIINDVRTDAWTESGLFQLQTIYDLGDIDLHKMQEVWFTYLDFHSSIWGTYVHNQDYLRNR